MTPPQPAERAGRFILGVRCGGRTGAVPGLGQAGVSARWAEAPPLTGGYPLSPTSAGDQETTTQQDLQRLLDNAADGLDVLVCHDAPEGTTGLVSGLPWEMPPSLQHEADTVQALLQSAVDETQPAVVFHGHWHQKNRCRLNARSEVVGLAADGSSPSAAVLSISDLQTRYVDPFQRSHRS